MNVTSEVLARIPTGLQYWLHTYYYSLLIAKSNESIIKDRGVNLHENEPESSINLVAFPAS